MREVFRTPLRTPGPLERTPGEGSLRKNRPLDYFSSFSCAFGGNKGRRALPCTRKLFEKSLIKNFYAPLAFWRSSYEL